MDINNLDNLILVNSTSGHSDGYDKDGNSTCVYYHFGKLYIKTENTPYNILPEFMIPMGFVMVPNKEHIISSVTLGDMSWSYNTPQFKIAQEYAKNMISKHNIDYEELKKQVIRKLSENYEITEKLREYLSH